MSYTRLDIDDGGMIERRAAASPFLLRAGSVAVWAVINAALLFAEHLAEFLAPLCFIGGGIWWAIPRGLAAITLDGPPGDILNMVRSKVPTEIYLDHTYYSAHTLLTYGIWLVGVVAVCRTLATALSVLLLDRR